MTFADQDVLAKPVPEAGADDGPTHSLVADRLALPVAPLYMPVQSVEHGGDDARVTAVWWRRLALRF